MPARLTAALVRALAAALALAVVPGAVLAQFAPVEDHQIKAVFLYNFANFISWPAHAFDGPRSPIRFCVLGDAQVADALERTLQGESVNGRALLVNRAPAADLKACHVVFVGAARRDRLGDALRAVEESPVLTVSDIDGFARRGGIVGLARENARVRPIVNTTALARAGLGASSKLLSLAVLVSSTEDAK